MPDTPAPHPHKQRTGLNRLWHATGYSLAGLRAGWREKAFRQEVLLAAVLLPLACWLGRGWVDALAAALPGGGVGLEDLETLLRPPLYVPESVTTQQLLESFRRARLQFALTAMYHFIFVPLTLGLSFMLVVMELAYVISGNSNLLNKDNFIAHWVKG